MKEAQENVARLPELAMSDFERICEFAYRGEYTNPQPVKFGDGDTDIKKDYYILSQSIASRNDEGLDRWQVRGFLVKRYGRLTLQFYEGSLDLDEVRNGWVSDDGLGNENSLKDLTPAWFDDISDVLLGHARLYVFADKYLILELRDLALHKLHKFLAGLQIYPLSIAAIFELVDYVYNKEYTRDKGDESSPEPLRELVIKFIIMHRKAFSKAAEHRTALKKGTEYAVDFVEMAEDMDNDLKKRKAVEEANICTIVVTEADLADDPLF
jgi:hypothetical protein